MLEICLNVVFISVAAAVASLATMVVVGVTRGIVEVFKKSK